jgi:hypothetical protein
MDQDSRHGSREPGLSSKQLRVAARLDQARAVSIERGGRLLSEEIKRIDVPVLWECERGHQWPASFASIRAGSWCPKCVGPLTMDDLHELAAARNGRCLSLDYRPGERVQWQCKNGHVWSALSGQVRLTWCPHCARSRRLEIKELKKVARLRGGRLLSTFLVNGNTPVWWQCAKGHVWKAKPGGVKPGKHRPGSWCQRCAWNARKGRSIPVVTLEDLREIAKQRGGECLSEEYAGSYNRLRWRCARGHEWMMPPTRVRSGAWCPACGRGVLEFSQIVETAVQHGGRVVSPESEWKDSSSVLRWQCEMGHQWDAPARRVRLGIWCPQCAQQRPLNIEQMRQLAAERGGECLSRRYINSKTLLKWRCAKGHVWKSTPNRIKPMRHKKQGQWCPVCARAPKRPIEEMRTIARSRGGECLSEYEFVHSRSLLRWRCGRGHVWTATVVQVARANGTWCPYCAREKRRTRRQV